MVIPFAVTLTALLFVIGAPPAFAQVDVEDWPGTVEVRVTGKTQGLTTGDVFTYELRLTEPPTEEGWWVRIHVDGVVYIDGEYNGLRWVPSVGWEFTPAELQPVAKRTREGQRGPGSNGDLQLTKCGLMTALAPSTTWGT